MTIFRRDPLLALECTCWVDGRKPPSADEVAVIDRSASFCRPRLRPVPDDWTDADGWDDDLDWNDVNCDLVLTVHRRYRDEAGNLHIGEAIELIWIVEIQLHRDLSRAQAWSDAITAAARQHGIFPANVHMLVVCPDPRIRGWLGARLFSRMKIRPSMLTRAHVPRLYTVGADGRHGADRPEPALLSAVFHGRDPRNLAIVRTALGAIAPLRFTAPQIHRDYKRLIGLAAHTTMTDQLPSLHDQPLEFEQELEDDPDDDASIWEMEGMTWRQVRERVVEETLLEARRGALLAMFELIGLEPTPTERDAILRCDSPARMADWVARVKGARQVSEVLGHSPDEPPEPPQSPQ